MISRKREIGLAILHSYGAMFETIMFLMPLEVVSLQALNRYMYRVGVPRSQIYFKFPKYFFTFGKDKRRKSIFIVSENLDCQEI